MAFNIVNVGTTEEEKETLLAGAGKCYRPKDSGVVASPVPQQADIVPEKTPAAYGSRFPYMKGKGAGAEGDGEY